MIKRPSKFKKNTYWWGCPNYPKCKVTSAEHPDGTIMSTPADQDLKNLRMKAHRLAEKIWGEWYEMNKDAKESMYSWLKENTKSGHIGKMSKNEILELIEKLKAIK